MTEQPSVDHNARNTASRARLAAVIGRLDSRTVILPGGWTAAALLAHLAFWERVTGVRWEKHFRVDAAGLPQWTATLSSAIADVTGATETVDKLIAGVSRDEAAELLRTRPRFVDRSLHRNEHLDEIEHALQ